MKKLIFTLALLLTVAAFPARAQSHYALEDIAVVNFYGVDYSMAHTYGASETGVLFKAAFTAINNLMLHEAHKFDIQRYFKVTPNIYDLEMAKARIHDIDPVTLPTVDKNYALTDEEVIGILNQYEFKQPAGFGLLIVAELLDKAGGNGYYTVVFFDIATKEVVYMQKASGAPGGGGLRNFWANSIYNMMKRWKVK